MDERSVTSTAGLTGECPPSRAGRVHETEEGKLIQSSQHDRRIEMESINGC